MHVPNSGIKSKTRNKRCSNCFSAIVYDVILAKILQVLVTDLTKTQEIAQHKQTNKTDSGSVLPQMKSWMAGTCPGWADSELEP